MSHFFNVKCHCGGEIGVLSEGNLDFDMRCVLKAGRSCGVHAEPKTWNLWVSSIRAQLTQALPT